VRSQVSYGWKHPRVTRGLYSVAQHLKGRRLSRNLPGSRRGRRPRRSLRDRASADASRRGAGNCGRGGQSTCGRDRDSGRVSGCLLRKKRGAERDHRRDLAEFVYQCLILPTIDLAMARIEAPRSDEGAKCDDHRKTHRHGLGSFGLCMHSTRANGMNPRGLRFNCLRSPSRCNRSRCGQSAGTSEWKSVDRERSCPKCPLHRQEELPRPRHRRDHCVRIPHSKAVPSSL
jgi:hypothetical protein